ncbi:hypothetical protein ASPTUDRAFT_313685 [Aspergillus tubingensis CBS 134.48]|uniref:Uncharacterized protein n=1 Tax=Aspergillus tubingensis (strain CBS 134.48) TaxID=767770 RepID=A0A1L9NQP3_ASPTC|nr:hypothetical protein ASPTUDRAFT_313685 [Aspergillus tubingensis CBS 134.48]
MQSYSVLCIPASVPRYGGRYRYPMKVARDRLSFGLSSSFPSSDVPDLVDHCRFNR